MSQEKIWEAFQNDESLIDIGFPARRRFTFIAEKIQKDCSTLNIGVGNGYLESILVNEGVTVSCLDPSESAIDKIRKHLALKDRAKVGYSQSIPFNDGSFDYVVMSEVLEHLSNDIFLVTLKEVARILKQGGKFIGTVPADENLDGSLVVCPECGEYFHRWGHVQSFSQESLFGKLNSTFNSVTVKRAIFNDYNQLNWKGKILMGLKEIQAILNLKGSNQNLFFEAKNR